MGTWGSGLLDSDSAQDFLDRAKEMPAEERSALIAEVLVRVAADASLVNREFVPEEVVAAAAVVAVTATESHDFDWMNNVDLLEVASQMDSQIHLRDIAISALGTVAGSGSTSVLSGWRSEDDRRSMAQQLDEIRSALSER